MIIPLMTGTSPTESFGDLLVGLAGWVLRGCAGWAVLITLAALVEAASDGRVRATSWVATPPAVRRALLAGLGILLAGAAPGPVSAAIAVPSSHRPEPLALPVPGRPEGRAPARALTVRAGDTLWTLAAARLPQGSDDAVVLAAVQRWYARNHRVIGSDPDLLIPGQRLVVPHHPSRQEPR